MTSNPQFEHIARVAYVNSQHGLVREQWQRHLEAPLLAMVLPSLEPAEKEHVGWIDFRCESRGACGYPQTYGGNPQRLCGDTYLAIEPHIARYSFLTSSEILAHPEQMTAWGLAWLRRVQKSDMVHPPFPRKRSDEIAGVLAKLPLISSID